MEETHNALIIAAAHMAASFKNNGMAPDPQYMHDVFVKCLKIVTDGWATHCATYKPKAV